MNLTEILAKRQSIRKFKDIDVPNEDIEEIVRAAINAPSGENLQNWHFAAIKDREAIRAIGDIVRTKSEKIVQELRGIDEKKAERYQKFYNHFTLFLTKAPVLLAIYSFEIIPPPCKEMKLIGTYEDLIEDNFHLRNPGVQGYGAALENCNLRAIDLGYGACWITSANHAAPEIEDFLKERFGFEKEGCYLATMMAIGVPDEGNKSPRKKTLEDIYTFLG